MSWWVKEKGPGRSRDLTGMHSFKGVTKGGLIWSVVMTDELVEHLWLIFQVDPAKETAKSILSMSLILNTQGRKPQRVTR